MRPGGTSVPSCLRVSLEGRVGDMLTSAVRHFGWPSRKLRWSQWFIGKRWIDRVSTLHLSAVQRSRRQISWNEYLTLWLFMKIGMEWIRENTKWVTCAVRVTSRWWVWRWDRWCSGRPRSLGTQRLSWTSIKISQRRTVRCWVRYVFELITILGLFQSFLTWMKRWINWQLRFCHFNWIVEIAWACGDRIRTNGSWSSGRLPAPDWSW